MAFNDTLLWQTIFYSYLQNTCPQILAAEWRLL